jgi:release factor glutamine methyltransferase
MKNIKINSKLNIKLKISNKVFIPTSTSSILIEASFKKINQKSKILDLGCGSGIIGISLGKILKTSSKIYFSDISSQAIEDVNFNANYHKIKFSAKVGSLFQPWKKEKFDFIINDIAAISEKIAKISNWYKNVSCDAGLDGTLLVNKVIAQSKKYLNDDGALILPLISLSNEKKILKEIKKNYKKVKLLEYVDWPLPKNMYKYKKVLYELKNKKKINFQVKWNMIICRTSVYMLK